MRILVIGGTRFIGPPTVRQLHAAGHEVLLFHRTPAQVELPDEIEHVLGDRNAMSDVVRERLRAFAPDIVLDMIPITETDAQGVVDLFRGVARRIVAVSSSDVYRAYARVNGLEPGEPDPVPLDEDAPLREQLYPYRGDMLRADDDPRKVLDQYDKILVERVYLSVPDLPGTSLRLPMVYGPGDYQHRVFEYLKRMDDDRPAILLNEQMARWRWTRGYVENVAAAITLAVTDDRAAGRVYNVGDAPTLSTGEWIQALARAAGWHGRMVTAPDYQLPEHMKSQAGFEQDLVTDTTRIREELGYEELVSLEMALRRTVAWERSNPPEQYDDAQFDYAAEDAILARL